MIYRNSYGVDLGQAGYQTKYKGPPVIAAEPKPNAVYVAEIVGWREGKGDWTISVRVIDEAGCAVINPNWQIAKWFPNVADEGGRPAPTHSKARPVAALYSLEELLAGIEERSPQGYVNDEGGPFEMWLDGPDIECPRWKVGWAGNHSYTGPYLQVHRKDGSTPTPPPVTPPAGGTARDDLRSAIGDMGDILLRLRDAEFRLP